MLMHRCTQAFSFEYTRRAKKWPMPHKVGRPLCGNLAAKRGDACFCLVARCSTYGPYMPLLDGSFRRAKNGPSQIRSPGCTSSNTTLIVILRSGNLIILIIHITTVSDGCLLTFLGDWRWRRFLFACISWQKWQWLNDIFKAHWAVCFPVIEFLIERSNSERHQSCDFSSFGCYWTITCVSWREVPQCIQL